MLLQKNAFFRLPMRVPCLGERLRTKLLRDDATHHKQHLQRSVTDSLASCMITSAETAHNFKPQVQR